MIHSKESPALHRMVISSSKVTHFFSKLHTYSQDARKVQSVFALILMLYIENYQVWQNPQYTNRVRNYKMLYTATGSDRPHDTQIGCKKSSGQWTLYLLTIWKSGVTNMKLSVFSGIRWSLSPKLLFFEKLWLKKMCSGSHRPTILK